MGNEKWPVRVSSYDFTGKTVVITGGTKGIGYGIAMAFARYNANVVVASRKQEDCDRVAEEIRTLGGTSCGIRADVTRTEDINNLIQTTVAEFGGVDILVNCAGIAAEKRLLEMDEDTYEKVMNTNFKSVLFASKAAAAEMVRSKKGGKIIHIASVGGLKGTSGQSLYSASKAAVLNLTKTMALEWSRYKIQVNAICPGYVVTEINRDVFENEAFRERTLKSIPQRRLGTVDEIAAIATFLASDLSNMINGEAIVADMGAICR